MPGQCSHALRRGRWSQPGGIYLITFACAGRRPWFAEWDAASRVARALASAEAWGDASLLCWVLMPDHWHGVLQLGERETLSRCVGRARAHATRAWKPKDQGRQLWQRSFHDRALRAEERLVDVARYVVMNPLRAGLVGRIGDYPYWDAVWITPDTSPTM
ncbi:transposase [Luteimonas sp. Sa2BVA3]|uniref:Transposase n=1 Tax=Luteimonas colneyensis TaxID=2762230 RepID=A0ABR8UJU3_9GAMM|nr:transposase [Luteimonas colneyensis]MBD7987934.1 transposase [Luteimonas colneyensis]